MWPTDVDSQGLVWPTDMVTWVWPRDVESYVQKGSPGYGLQMLTHRGMYVCR